MKKFTKKIDGHYELDHKVAIEEMKKTHSSLLDVLIQRAGELEEKIGSIDNKNCSVNSLNKAESHKTIEKKILPQYFEEVIKGNKTFELRKDENNIQVGDRLVLREYDNGFTGRYCEKLVTYVLRNVKEYGLMDGYCIISI